MARVSRNASIPYLPYSRPTPEYLNPPQYPRGAGDTRAADRIEPDAPGADDHNRIAGVHVGGV